MDNEGWWNEPRCEVAGFDNPTSNPQSLRNLKSIGWINCQLVLELIDKRPLPNGRGYEFTFADWESTSAVHRVRGISFKKNGETNFRKFRTGYTYIVEKVIWAARRNKKFGTDLFTSDYEIELFKVKILEETLSPPRWAGGIREIIENVVSGRTELGLMYLNDVSFEEGHLLVYTGCEHCQKKISEPNPGNGKYYCPNSNCSGGTGARNRKVYMILQNVKIKDAEGNILGDVVLFNNSCEKIIGQPAENFFFDSAPRRIVESHFGTRLNLRIIYKDFNIRAHVLHVFERDSSSNTTNGVPCIFGNIGAQLDPIPVDTSLGLETDQAQGVHNHDEERSHDFDYDEDYDTRSPFPDDIQDSYAFPPLIPGIEHLRRGNYDRNSNPRGYALIINNNYFPLLPEKDKYRHGSEIDVNKLRELLPRLDMPVYDVKVDVTKSELLGIIEEFIKYLIEEEVDSCMVVIMSHGAQNVILTVDGDYVNFYTEILPLFSNSSFPQFEGKPKIFINQTCQSFSDTGITHSNFPPDFQTPNYSDILICMPQAPGEKALRLASSGAMFIQYICQVFETFAQTMEIQEMMTLVINQINSVNAEGRLPLQYPYCLPLRFSRGFRFFP